MELKFNKFQSTLEQLNIDSYPEEIKESFFDFLNNVPYIKALVSPDRPYAKDCPRDKEEKIIVDLTNPPKQRIQIISDQLLYTIRNMGVLLN